MHAYTELLKPSVVTNSLVLPANARHGEILIIIRGSSLLQVFTDIQSPEGPQWVAEFPLQGHVTHLTSIASEYVVLTFLQAKMSILKWNQDTLTFTTKSLHYYEKLKEDSTFDIGNAREHTLSVDARNMCLTFWFQKEFAAFVRFQNLVDPLRELSLEHGTGENESNEIKAQSSVINIQELTALLRVSRIIAIEHLSAYREPTLAVLAWEKPSWAGLAGADGPNTKVLCIVSMKLGEGGIRFNPLARSSDVSYSVNRIFPVTNVPNCLAIVAGSDGVQALSEACELCDFNLEKEGHREERFENCVICQFPETPYVILSLESGTKIILDAEKYREEPCSGLVAAGRLSTEEASTSIAASRNSLVLSFRHGNTKIFNWSMQTVGKHEPIIFEGSSLNELYSQLINHPRPEKRLDEIKPCGELVSYGSLSSVTSIDNALACSTKDGIVIVERELPFDEINTAPLKIDIDVGRFWIVSSTVPSKPILISTFTERENLSEEDGTPKKRKRRRSETMLKEYTRFSEVFTSDLSNGNGSSHSHKSRNGNSTQKKMDNVPRGIASDQLTLAIRESKDSVLVVQSKSISYFDSRTWKVKKRTSIPHSHFAEIRDEKILVQTLKSNECLVYDSVDLQLLGSYGSNDLSSVSTTSLLTVNIQTLTVHDIYKKESSSYDIGNLDRECCPRKEDDEDLPDLQEDPHKKEETNDIEESGTPRDSVVALFALAFNGVEYIGLHIGRVFSIYEQHGPNLLKRYSVPFAINQSPIFIPELELLFFPGAKSHVVVKGRQSGFNCHRLQLYGDHLVDITSSLKQTKATNVEHELVWLDDKDMLHFVQLDYDIDYFSNSMPIRFIPLEIDELVSIKDISYHDDYAAVLVGANVRRPFIEATPEVSATEDGDGEGEAEEPVDGDQDEASESIEQQEESKESSEEAANEEAAKEETVSDVEGQRVAQTFEGRVYVLPLTTYMFQTKAVAEFKEMLMCLKLVDHGESGGKQMLAVGTAQSTVEHEETNGHIYVYKLYEDENQEADTGRSSIRSEKSDGSEDYRDDSLPICLDLFAEQEVRGAVSNLCETMGFLAAAHGQQLHLYNFHKGLEPIGFFDTQVYMQDLKSLRNIIILGERLRGPRLVNFALQPHRLDILASSDNQAEPSNVVVTTAVEGISSAVRGDLAVAHADSDGRIQILQYDPENPASNGGPRLVPLASFFTGRLCNSMIAVQLYANDDIIAYGADADGAVFSIKPLNEEVFRTFFVLTQQMMDKETPDAGLNPRMHRATLSSLQNHSHQLIDVNYALQFWNLPLSRQAEYARRLGFEGLARVRRALNSEGRDALKL